MEQGNNFDVLIIDDNSPDGTGKLADEMAKDNPRIQVIHRKGKLGLGTAYVAGFKYALGKNYDFIFEMDADFSHNPADLPRLLEATNYADLVIGSRWVRGGGIINWSPLRRAISRGGSLYARFLLGVPVKDLTSGFKCFRREALASLDLDLLKSNGYGFQVEVNYICSKAGFRLKEVPIIFPDRVRGKSKMSGKIVLEAMGVVWKLRHKKIPLQNISSSSQIEQARSVTR
jgi:dolichol-phosphate mannosyltransferase